MAKSTSFGSDGWEAIATFRGTIAGREVIGHNGGDQGVSTQMVFAPDTGVGVILLMNVGWTSSLATVADEIQGLLFDRAETQ